MRPELQDAINQWKTEAIHEARDVSGTRQPNGEYIMVISATIDLVIGDKKKAVYQYKFLMTMAQATNTTYNPAGDVYHFKKASELVISRLFDEYSMAIEQFLNDNNRGFTQL